MSRRPSARLLQEGQVDPDKPETGLVAGFCAAALSSRVEDAAELLHMALAQGVGHAALTDDFIANAVRRLGALWAEDQISWTDVTIGTARLQSLLRHMDKRIDAGRVKRPDAARVLLISGVDMAHTFGPMLLAHQMRRQGISVALSLETAPGTVCEIFGKIAPDAVFLTASHCDGVETLAQLVKEVRVFNSGIPIVVGGPLLCTETDIAHRIGADYATSDLEKALTLCDLRNLTARKFVNP
ncbi:B12-binding domain-containing protein [Loktanella sp. 3ANDIMAR09]|uniref:cobalamin B12-binding domain-containing protein n=1 Tax=Loktanella sp. 3ANDIMAR09 TaxID=1225657 RepID=UPI000B310D3A|nr:hypothetical protein [Loktanella sp. 3ANDIMAR09]